MEIINVPNKKDNRGVLSIIENIQPFEIKRVYYITQVPNRLIERGGHKHKICKQLLVCLNGSCSIHIINKQIGVDSIVILDSESKSLLLEPGDWHKMFEFSQGSVLLVLASEKYDPDDYILEI